MPEVEKDYSDFTKHLSISTQSLALFAGFTLTVLVLLLTGVSDPSPILMQVILFLLAFLFVLFIFLMEWVGQLDLCYIKNMPPYTRGMRICGFFDFTGIVLFCVVVTLLFVFFNLTFLAAATFVMYFIMLVLGYFLIEKPQREIRIKTSEANK